MCIRDSLKAMKCPHCGSELTRDGFDIAFETFLGFTGEKVPDIDLNFSGEYQAKAHLFCQETFGIDNAFRAGTVSTVQIKTAYAYARDYYQSKGIFKRQTELERLAKMLSESKRTTGQHPDVYKRQGIGGLTVYSKIVEAFKNENIVYLADTKNCPYGTKDLSLVREITLNNIEYLKNLGAKIIIIACNTATSSITCLLYTSRCV